MATTKANTCGLLYGSKVCRTTPPISHLLFADDCLLFCKATSEECMKLRNILDNYRESSGQVINVNKTGIFYSKNVEIETRTRLSNILGVQRPLNTGRYLDLHSLVGCDKG